MRFGTTRTTPALPFTPMQGDMYVQSLSRFKKRKAGGFRRAIGLLKVFWFARFQTPCDLGIDLSVGL